MSVIEVDRLTKDYGFGRGVFDVSFSVGRGEVFGFLGPNGAGKSTTIRHLMGFSRPQSGSAKIFGKESFSSYAEILANVGYIPGEIALPVGLTGLEFLEMMRKMRGETSRDKLEELLELFKLDPSGETKRMSLGVKRKLAVVTAFMHDPEVLVLDEPTSGLDPVMQDVFIDYVRKEKERGKTILLSSHIFSEVDATCDRIAIIKDGKIVSEFAADDLKHASRKTYEATFAEKAGFEAFSAGGSGVYEVVERDEAQNRVVFASEDKDVNGVLAALAKCGAADFSERKQTLQDYFMSYYKEEKDFGGALSR